MRNVGCKENRKGATLAAVTAAIFLSSRIYRKKPTPNIQKVDSRILSSRRFYAYHIWDEV